MRPFTFTVLYLKVILLCKATFGIHSRRPYAKLARKQTGWLDGFNVSVQKYFSYQYIPGAWCSWRGGRGLLPVLSRCLQTTDCFLTYPPFTACECYFCPALGSKIDRQWVQFPYSWLGCHMVRANTRNSKQPFWVTENTILIRIEELDKLDKHKEISCNDNKIWSLYETLKAFFENLREILKKKRSSTHRLWYTNHTCP